MFERQQNDIYVRVCMYTWKHRKIKIKTPANNYERNIFIPKTSLYSQYTDF